MKYIKFRGKDAEGGAWRHGDLIQRLGNYPAILSQACDSMGKIRYTERCVYKKTVGQFVGLHDKDGREIYEGDILTNGIHDYLVEWDEDDAQWVYRRARTKHEISQLTLYFDRRKMEEANLVVFGNIHDNPEKLKLWRKDLE